MATLISGSTGVNKITDGTITNADIASGAAIAGSKLVMSTGTVLQVVTGETTVQTVMNSTTFAATSLSASITPSSTSSKILVQLTSNLESNTAGERAVFAIYRGSEHIAEGHTLQPSGASGSSVFPIALQKLDSPSTASAVTYYLYIKRTSATIVANINGGGSTTMGTITLMEIAG